MFYEYQICYIQWFLAILNRDSEINRFLIISVVDSHALFYLGIGKSYSAKLSVSNLVQNYLLRLICLFD